MMKKRILTAILCLVFLMAFAGLSMAAEFNLRLGHGGCARQPTARSSGTVRPMG